MKTPILATLALLAATTLLVAGFSTKSVEPSVTVTKHTPPDQILIKRGEYLVSIMGCNDCHSPKTMGPQGPEPVAGKLLSGYPADRPLPGRNADVLKDWVLFNSDNTALWDPGAFRLLPI